MTHEGDRPMRVAVCGGRTYGDQDRLWAELDALYVEFGPLWLITGACSGADFMAGTWARTNPDKVAGLDECPANWKLYGRSAGPRRNQEMVDIGKPDKLLAFPGGRGTADMVRRCVAAGVRVIHVGAVESE